MGRVCSGKTEICGIAAFPGSAKPSLRTSLCADLIFGELQSATALRFCMQKMGQAGPLRRRCAQSGMVHPCYPPSTNRAEGKVFICQGPCRERSSISAFAIAHLRHSTFLIGNLLYSGVINTFSETVPLKLKASDSVERCWRGVLVGESAKSG